MALVSEPAPSRNFIYEFVLRARIDGVLFLSADLASACGIERFVEWTQGFARIPNMTIGLSSDDHPCVSADCAPGIRAIVRHLVEVHGRKRIAYVRGPSQGPEAGARYRSFQAALVEQGMRLDERLVVEQSQLGWGDGMAAVRTLFDKRRFTPRTLDAIACFNDEVARGVLEALRTRSIAVPEQVAVVGYDDGSRASSTNPPLTTVAQKVEQQAFTATCHLIKAIQEGTQPSSSSLPTEPVLRASCGCFGPLENDSSKVVDLSTGVTRTCRLALLEHRTAMAKSLLNVARERLVNAPDWEQRILDALLRDLTTGTSIHVVRALETVARRHAALGGDISACHDVLTELRLLVLAYGGTEPQTRPLLEDLLHEARLVLGRVGLDVERERRETLGRRMRAIAHQVHALLNQDSFAELASVLDEILPTIGIKSFIISQFLDATHSTELEVVCRRSQGEWATPIRRVDAADLGLDQAMEQGSVVVIEPLELGAAPLGIAAFAWAAEMPVHYEDLRQLLSAALRALQLRGASLGAPATN